MGILSAGRFIRYFLFAGHGQGHGIHSPFVFDLVYRVFRNKIEPDIVFTIEKIRKRLISDHRLITVNDLGAGSKRMKTNLRKVSDIARYSAVPMKYGIFLSNMSGAFGDTFILEFGTSLGISTMYMAASCPGATVVTMEGCSGVCGIASANFREAGLDNIRLLNGSFDDLLHGIKREKSVPGLVFIDGNHRREAVTAYFSHVVEMSGNDTVVVIDDINSSREMSDAWNEIKNHENVTLTIDIFRMGVVFFREGMTRLNYVIRY